MGDAGPGRRDDRSRAGQGGAQQEVKGEDSASDLVLGCTEQLVVLEDVVPAGSRAGSCGVADRRFARPHRLDRVRRERQGRRHGEGGGRRLVRGLRAAAAPSDLRHSNRALRGPASAQRAEARASARWTRSSSPARWWARSPPARPIASWSSSAASAARARNRGDDDAAPERLVPDRGRRARRAESAAVYRLRTKVRRSAASRGTVDTFTLPRGWTSRTRRRRSGSGCRRCRRARRS